MISPEKRIKSIFGSPYETYFQNGAPNPAGDLLGGGIGFPTQRNDWWDTREMWTYPYYNFNLMIGDGRATYRNEKGFQCELSPGTFFFTFPDVKQQYAPALNAYWGDLYVSFAGGIFEAIRMQGILAPERPVWHIAKPEPWEKRMKALLQEPIPATSTQSLRRAVRFLGYILEMLEKAEQVQATNSASDWFTIACQLLTGDLHHKVNLQDIAGDLGMCYHTFRIYFTRRAGIPPLQYRDEARIKVACEFLVKDTRKPCKEIAFILGYNSPQHFSSQVKKFTGLSPEQYCKKHRK